MLDPRRISALRRATKLTLVGALALAGSAIGGGVLMTSHAMAADATPPATGTLTIVIRQTGAGDAIRCTFTGVALPAPPTGAGEPGTHLVQAGGLNHGVVSIEGAPAPAPDGASGPLAVRTSGTVGGGTGPGTLGVASGQVVSGASVDPAGTPPLPPIVDATNARPGTAEECSAVMPTAAP